MKITSIGQNKTELELKDLKLLISYQTPVALIRFPGGALKTSEFFSVTTSKHINQWFDENGYNPKIVPTQDQEFFEQFLEDNK